MTTNDCASYFTVSQGMHAICCRSARSQTAQNAAYMRDLQRLRAAARNDPRYRITELWDWNVIYGISIAITMLISGKSIRIRL